MNAARSSGGSRAASGRSSEGTPPRILERATTWEAGLLDPRLVAPLKVAKHNAIEGLVREYLQDNVYRST